MSSECARASSAAESRFRISSPNSVPRAVTIVSLDQTSDRIIERLGRMGWVNAVFLSASIGASPSASAGVATAGLLRDLGGRAADLVGEVNRADLVVMLATLGQDLPAASVVGQTCRILDVTTLGFVGACNGDVNQRQARTLAQLRPYCQVLVGPTDAVYLADMLSALRA